MRKVLSAVCLSACAVAVLSARQAPQQPSATFRTDVSIVTLDVTVLDKNGMPVPGLRAEDFEVKLGGKPAAIRAVAYAQAAQPVTPGAVPAAQAIASQAYSDAARGRHPISNVTGAFATASTVSLPAPPVRPTQSVEPRIFVIVVDDLSFLPLQGKALFQAGVRFLDKLPPSDLAGFTTTSGEGAVNPTRDRSAVKAALAKVVGQFQDPRGLRASGPTRYANAVNGTNSRDSAIGFNDAIDIDRGDDTLLKQVIIRECYGGDASMWGNRSVQQVIADDQCASDVYSESRRTAALMRQHKYRQLEGFRSVISAMRGAAGIRHIIFLSQGIAMSREIDDLKPVVKEAAAAGVELSLMLEEPGASMQDEGRRVTAQPDEVSNAGQAQPNQQVDIGAAQRRREDDALFLTGAQTLTEMMGGTFYRVFGRPDRFFDEILNVSSAVYRLGVELPPGFQIGQDISAAVKVNRAGLTAHSNRMAVRVAPPPDPTTKPMTGPAPRPAGAPPIPITTDDLVAAAVRDGIAYTDLPVRMGASIRKSTNAFDAIDLSVQAVLPAGIKGPLITEISVTDSSGQPKGARRILEAQPDGRFVASFLFPLKAGGYTIRFAAADADGRIGSVEMGVPVTLPKIGGFTASDVITWTPVDGKPQVFVADDAPASAQTINASIELYPTGVLSMAERHVHWSVLPAAGGAPVFEADAPATAGPAFLRSDVEVPWSRLAPGSYTIRATLVVGGANEGAMAATVLKK